MKVELKAFQEDAVYELQKRLIIMRSNYDQYESLSAVSLTAPTGAGKTVMAAAIIEGLFFGDADAGIEADPKACVLWLSDSPSLNDQTRARFVEVSDKLASWFTDERHLEVVDSDFGATHETLEPRHVYFLNKQMLSRNSILSKATELNGGRIFWDILNATIQNPSRHLYLFIDEAHRGIGTNASTSERDTATIYAHLIDGFEGRSPMPIVVGISATPQRFEQAMRQRGNRTLMPAVDVSPKDVQESGLLKDTIELRVPEEDDAVEHQYLDMACERLKTAETAWKAYCDAEGITPAVAPLLVVQVADNITDAALKSLCDQITRKLPHLNTQTCFANVFGEHKDRLPAPNYFMPYMEPENIQETRSVRVLFAKEAISNGWDCPRAEVIYSQRRRSDDTYIAQLIGRMVRTPLARRVEADETLNSVACFLPAFDPDATQSVIDYLTGKSDDFIGGSVVKEVLTNPVTISWQLMMMEPEDEEIEEAIAEEVVTEEVTNEQPSMELTTDDDESENVDETETEHVSEHHQPAPQNQTATVPRQKTIHPGQKRATAQHENDEKPPDSATEEASAEEEHTGPVEVFTAEELKGIRAAWGTLRKRINPKKPRNQFVSLIDTATLLMETGLDKGAGADVRNEFCNRVDAEIVAYPTEYKKERHNVEVAEMQVITIDRRHDDAVTRRSESPLIDEYGLNKAAERALVEFGGKDLVNAYRKQKILGEGLENWDVNLILAGVARTEPIVKALERWADTKRKQYFDKYSTERAYLSEEERQHFDTLRQLTSGIRDSEVDFPTNLIADGNLPRYARHILYDPADGLAPLALNNWEIDVLRTEMARERTVAFYRIPNNYQPSVFSIPYAMPDGRRSLRPDFIFFVRKDGVIRPAIVDPHGDFLSDAIPKLRGYVEYLRDYPEVFVQVLSVSKMADGEYRFLDLLDAETQQSIMDFEGDQARELYVGPLSFPYVIENG